MINYILIDLGNTIINNVEFNLSKGLLYLYDMVDVKKISSEAFVSMASKYLQKIFKKRTITHQEVTFQEYLKGLMKLSKMSFKTSLDSLELTFYNLCVNDTLNLDAYAFLAFCKKQNIKVYCYSNTFFSKRAIEQTLKKFKLDELIEAFYFSSTYTFRKPSKAFFLKTEASKIIDLKESLMVGNDYEIDGGFAKKIGVNFAWYNLTNTFDDAKKATLIFTSYQQLKEYILNND